MCLILFAYQAHDDYPLIVAANRDEWHARPTAPAQFWTEYPELLAGQDLQAGGTWMGVTRSGRFAALTNFRDIEAYDPAVPSRGHLVRDYLIGNATADAYFAELAQQAGRYRGFNMLASDKQGLYFYSNRQTEALQVPPGVHGLSNALLDSPWPKVRAGMARLHRVLQTGPSAEALIDLLDDRVIAQDNELPQTGVSLEWERRLSAAHILHPEYGTRSSTVLLQHRSGHHLWMERSYDAQGVRTKEAKFEFDAAL